jgi:hypothetical protein
VTFPCAITPASQFAVHLAPIFAVFAACELMDWPKFERIDRDAELWSLAVAAVKEIQSLSIHREAGQKAARETTEAGLAASLAAWEKDTLPLGTAEFNCYHHGGKVNLQDRQHLRDCIAYGEAKGKKMAALKTLLQRTEEREAVPA